MSSNKEMPLAFVPSPNDALHGFPSVTSAAFSRDDSAIMSPGQESGISSPRLHALPTRDKVGSASELPPALGIAVKSPLDQQHWYSLYNDALEARQRDQDMWARERAGLRHEIEVLKEQLSRIPELARHDSRPNGISKEEAEKYTFNASMVNHATEKLRQFSVISPASTRRSSQEPAESGDRTDGIGRRTSSQTRGATNGNLKTIEENEAGPKKQVELLPVIEDIIVTPSVPGQPEDPFSPLPSARLSPPPPEYTKHAGHTPLISRSNRTSFKEEERNPSKLLSQTLQPSAVPPPAHPALANLDEDPELSGEKILPTTPTEASQKGLQMLTELDSKLNDIAEHPYDNLPVAVQVADVLDKHAAATANEKPATEEFRSGGIPLRIKRSTNFGAPLGSIRM